MISDFTCGVHLYVLFAPDNYLQAYYTEYDLLRHMWICKQFC